MTTGSISVPLSNAILKAPFLNFLNLTSGFGIPPSVKTQTLISFLTTCLALTYALYESLKFCLSTLIEFFLKYE